MLKVPKSTDTPEASTRSDENKDTDTVDNVENGSDGQPPPQKKKRLSNREYKKLTKGQNKVRYFFVDINFLHEYVLVRIAKDGIRTVSHKIQCKFLKTECVLNIFSHDHFHSM